MSHIIYVPGADGVASFRFGHGCDDVEDDVIDQLSEGLDAFLRDESQMGAIFNFEAVPVADQIRYVMAARDNAVAPEDLRDWAVSKAAVLRRLENGGKPVAAVISAPLNAMTAEIALACHRRISTNKPSATFGLNLVEDGVLPFLGATQRLPRLAGVEAAFGVMMDGKTLGSDEAFALGIFDEIVTCPNMAEMAARAWLSDGPAPNAPWDQKRFVVPGGTGPLAPHAARSFQARTSRTKAKFSRYPAPRAMLSAVYEGTQVPFDAGGAIEADLFGQVASSAVARNMMLLRLSVYQASSTCAIEGLAMSGSDAAMPWDQLFREAPGDECRSFGVSDGYSSTFLGCARTVVISYVNEALSMVAEGVPAPLIENAAKASGFAVRPLLGASPAVLREWAEAKAQAGGTTGVNSEEFRDALFSLLVEAPDGQSPFYRKTGERLVLRDDLAEVFGVPPVSKSSHAVEDRLLSSPAAALRDYIAQRGTPDLADADIASVTLAGYPRWTGGPTRYRKADAAWG